MRVMRLKRHYVCRRNTREGENAAVTGSAIVPSHLRRMGRLQSPSTALLEGLIATVPCSIMIM